MLLWHSSFSPPPCSYLGGLVVEIGTLAPLLLDRRKSERLKSSLWLPSQLVFFFCRMTHLLL